MLSGRKSIQPVLIVDQSPENREVLRTALRRRGINTVEAADLRCAAELLNQYRPHVTVLDSDCLEDTRGGDSKEDRSCLASHCGDDRTSLVLIGRTARGQIPRAVSHIFDKPYHFAPLVRTIEELVNR